MMKLQSEIYLERTRRVAVAKMPSTESLFLRSAQGAELIDVDGRRFTDFSMAAGSILFGHGDEDVRIAATKALAHGWSYGGAELGSLELAELISDKLPWIGKTRFVNSRTEAVMSAIRVARAATGRSKILKFDACHHGQADSMLVGTGAPLPGVPIAVGADTLVMPLDDLASAQAALELLGSDIAAVIIEPLPASQGLLLPRVNYLSRLCTLARRAGALVIFDESVSGFRVAFGGMVQHTGVEPDLITYGKVLGAGFPLAAYAGRKELMSRLEYLEGVNPEPANPVSVAVALTLLRKLELADPYSALSAQTAALAALIEARCAHLGVRVQTFASLFWLVLEVVPRTDGVARALRDIPGGQRTRYTPLFHGMLKRGFYLPPSGFDVAFTSLAHTPRQLADFATALSDTLNETCNGP